MKKPINNKKALVVGTGKWGKIFINFLIKKEYMVFYANRNLEIDNELEKKHTFRDLKVYRKENNENYDILILCLRPDDILNAWKTFRNCSKNILIEKPGTLNYKDLKHIIDWCKEYEKKLLINYEYYYTETAYHLRKILKENYPKIAFVKLFWEKDLGDAGNLYWRLLPHLISEIYFGKESFEIVDFVEDRVSIIAKGFIGDLPFVLNIKNSKKRIHGIKIFLIDNHSYLKNENSLYYDDRPLINNERSELEHMISLFEENDLKLFEVNHSMSIFIVKILEKIIIKRQD